MIVLRAPHRAAAAANVLIHKWHAATEWLCETVVSMGWHFSRWVSIGYVRFNETQTATGARNWVYFYKILLILFATWCCLLPLSGNVQLYRCRSHPFPQTQARPHLSVYIVCKLSTATFTKSENVFAYVRARFHRKLPFLEFDRQIRGGNRHLLLCAMDFANYLITKVHNDLSAKLYTR
jgi:hypothetical protein